MEKYIPYISVIISLIALVTSLATFAWNLYSYTNPPKPKFKIISNSYKSNSLENDTEIVKYQIFVRNYSKGEGILKLKGITTEEPSESKKLVFSILENNPYQDKFHVFHANSISQDIIELKESFVKMILSGREQDYFYIVFVDENNNYEYSKVKLYGK